MEASKDNTLYESSTGSLSNGAGNHLFAGLTNNGQIRRGLIMFDVAAALPDGAVVESATLEMNMSKTIAAGTQISIHRVMADWGEGTSDAEGNEGGGTGAANGDATWLHRFFQTDTWQSPGGDYAPAPSASAVVSTVGSYEWDSTPAMLADIQDWIDSPDENFGWILIGDESASPTTKRFDSRTHPTADNRPVLRLTFRTATASESDELPLATVLEGAWPNPFRSSTQLGFSLERDALVSLEVFDVSGRQIATLASGWRPAGRHEVTFEAGDGVPAGVYISRLTAATGDGGESVQTRTLVLAR